MSALHRAGGRATSTGPGLVVRHAFASGPHYDPANTSYGALVRHDEVLLQPGAGFAAHRHRGVDVVTVVLEGALRHEHDGRVVVVPAGGAQVLRTAGGVAHAEACAGDRPVRFVQAWVLADPHGPASYDVVPALPAGEVVTVASGLPGEAGPGPAVPLGAGAALRLVRLDGGSTATLAGPAHVHVVGGSGACDGLEVGEGDAVRAAGPVQLAGALEALVWELPGAPVPAG